VSKGSRQNRSVTSGKGLALKIEYKGPGSEVGMCGGWDGLRKWSVLNVVLNHVGFRVVGSNSHCPCTTNNRFRTVSDKGNPTV